MKKKYFAVILIIIFFASISITSAGMPEVSISVSKLQKPPENGVNIINTYVDEDITFETSVSGGFSTNTHIVKASWDFGDGSPQNGTKITHKFKANKWHNLNLVVNTNDDSGNNIVISQNYKIHAVKRQEPTPSIPIKNNNPELSITISDFQPLPKHGNKTGKIYYNENIIFTAFISGDFTKKTKLTKITWNFGDGTRKTGITTQHLYKKTGWYTITLIGDSIDNSGKTYKSSNTFSVYAVKRQEPTPSIPIKNNNPELSITISDFQPLPKHGNKTAQVNLNEKLILNVFISGKLSNKTKITKATWNFGDGTRKTGITTHHLYKKTGWYNIKLTASSIHNKKKYNITNNYKIYVVKKPDLSISSLRKNYDSKKNVVSINVIVKNKGALTTKTSYMKIEYISKQLKKYSKTGLIKSLKPGQSTKIKIAFKIPYKYRNQVKNIKIDYTNKITESIEVNNNLKFT